MNLQTLPRTAKVVKECFTPKLDAFLFFDYKSVEYRFLAYFLAEIGYPEMAEAFKSGLDPHTETAKVLFEKETVDDEERQIAKVFNFGSIYMAGPWKIREMVASAGRTISFPEAEVLHERFYERNPGIRKLSWPQPRKHRTDWRPGVMERVLEERGRIRTPWGRELVPEYGYKGLNYLIQGSAADLMRSAIVKVAEFQVPYSTHLVMTIHDEVVCDCLEKELPAFTEEVPKLMADQRISNVVPIEVDVEVSYNNWATKEEYG